MPPHARRANGQEPPEEMSITGRLSLVPLRHTKTVHFIRHAQGFHNVAGEKNLAAYKDIKYQDAHLTEVGWQQVKSLPHEALDEGLARAELVIVSPMCRTLETACGIFGNPSPTDDEPILMEAHDSIQGVRSARSRFSSQHSPPLLAIEACRERCDGNPCDQRRPTSYYRLNFPGVDFSQIEDEEDPVWMPQGESGFESRIHTFLEYLCSRPESHIAVVSHSGFLRTLCRQFGSELGAGSRDVLHWYFKNCEMRSMVLCEKFGSEHQSCDFSYPGGTQSLAMELN